MFRIKTHTQETHFRLRSPEQSLAQAACIKWHEDLDTVHSVLTLMIFETLMLRAKILCVVVHFPPEADCETNIQGQLVSREGFQEILVGTGNERKPIEPEMFVC